MAVSVGTLRAVSRRRFVPRRPGQSSHCLLEDDRETLANSTSANQASADVIARLRHKSSCAATTLVILLQQRFQSRRRAFVNQAGTLALACTVAAVVRHVAYGTVVPAVKSCVALVQLPHHERQQRKTLHSC